jgi:hypothetical protein
MEGENGQQTTIWTEEQWVDFETVSRARKLSSFADTADDGSNPQQEVQDIEPPND